MRTIDADALQKEYMHEHDGKRLMLIDVAPTIEPERKKGRWIDNSTTCSECGWQMIDDVIQTPNMVGCNFCPNCGADMREEAECK